MQVNYSFLLLSATVGHLKESLMKIHHHGYWLEILDFQLRGETVLWRSPPLVSSVTLLTSLPSPWTWSPRRGFFFRFAGYLVVRT